MVFVNNYNVKNIKNDILSGSVVAVALVPEAIAFSFIAGVSPIVGLLYSIYSRVNNFSFWW